MVDVAAPKRRAALVTGASYGIGGAIAAGLAADGFDVAVTDLDAADLAETSRRIEAAGGRSLTLSLDIRSDESIEQCFAAATEAFGALDLLVNNAGVPSLLKPIVDISRAEWDGIIAVNLTGTFFMSQRMGRHLIERGRSGQIISIASTHGLVGLSGASAYGIAKAGVAHMTRMMAIEWAETGIRANAVAPGTTMTESRAQFLADPDRSARALARIPIGRFADPGEIAAAVRYLAGPAATYVNGHTLVLDGGLSVA